MSTDGGAATGTAQARSGGRRPVLVRHKMIGVAMLIAIVVDATVVRILLVPATMGLLGRANWYAPGPLRRLYVRCGIRESDGEPAPQAGERESAAAR